MEYKNYMFAVALCIGWWGCSSDHLADDLDKDNPASSLPETGRLWADFETYDTTPYVFRYGNAGGSKMSDYYPRWVYSHTVVDNPVKGEANMSSKVLEYTSMEARNYGLKLRFSEPVALDDIKGIRLKIYQPSNVLGKATWQGSSGAVAQQLAVKLIGRFNAVNDYEQEEGILLTGSSVDFREEGVWKSCTFTFSRNEYSAAATQLKNGIAGLVILPTYGSGVTLAEENKYKCYIDDIEIL